MSKKLLTDVCDIQYGYAFDSKLFNETEGYPVVRIRDIVRGYSETKTTEKCPENYYVNNGDILIGMDGEFNIARWHGGKAVLNQRVCKLIPKHLDSDYLLYYMPKALKEIEFKTPFVTVKHLSAKELNRVLIPFPEYETQIKISRTLKIIDNLYNNSVGILTKLDTLVKSRFVEMFGDPFTNTLRWIVEPLTNHLSVIGGYAFKSDLFVEDGIPVLRIGNINTGAFRPTNLVFWKDDVKLDRYKIYPGDLVISLTGTVGKNDYGNVCVLGDDYDVYYLNQRNAKLELRSTIDKVYLSELLKFDRIKQRLTGISRGVRQANISNKDILNLCVPIPPIKSQNQFADFVIQVEKQKATVQQSIDKLETLKKSLMQEYFG